MQSGTARSSITAYVLCLAGSMSHDPRGNKKYCCVRRRTDVIGGLDHDAPSGVRGRSPAGFFSTIASGACNYFPS